MRTRQLNGLLIVASLFTSTAPLYAQREQQNVAKLKADARNLVGIIGSDKTKTQTYCQIEDLTDPPRAGLIRRLIFVWHPRCLIFEGQVSRIAFAATH